MRRDLLGILEAAYADVDEARWRAALLDAAGVLDRGLGLVFARSLVEGGAHRYADVATSAKVPKRLVREFVAAGDRVDGATLQTFARSAGRTGSMLVGEEAISATYGRFMNRHGVADCIGVNGIVDDTTVVGLYVLLPRFTHLHPRTVRQHELVGVHLSAAVRSRTSGATDEAWVAPSGRVLDARGDAEGDREPIARRVRAIEATRTRRGRSDVDQALALWKGLVTGRWTLLERFDSDGRRHFVARRNAPRFALATRLTPREAAVATLIALGQSQKLVAYTLGLSPARVSALLDGALLKLGACSISDLVTLGAALLRREPADLA